MSTHDHEDADGLPSREAKEGLAPLRRDESPNPRRTSVLIIDRARLARESLAYFLQERASDLNVHAVEAIADAAKQQLEPPDIILVNLRAADVDQVAVRQIASELETAFGRKIPTLIILQGEEAALDEVEVVRLGIQGCFSASLGVCMLVAAIRLVSSGGVFLPPRAIQKLALLS